MKIISSANVRFACLALAVAIAPALAQSAHVLVPADKVQWGPAPPVLPAGAQISVLEGDPHEKGPVTLRLKFPANYVIPAHSHPTDENVVVVSGAVTFGVGEAVAK